MKDHHRMRAWDGKRYWYLDLLSGTWNDKAESTLQPYALQHWEIELCTGLRDKNGVLIYEGDILSEFIEDKEGDYVDISVVFFKNWMTTYREGDLLINPDYVEIIGTIRQTPELLEAK